MQWQEFQLILQKNEQVAPKLWSGTNLEALAFQFEAYQAAWSVKQLLQTAMIIDYLGEKPMLSPFNIAEERQRISNAQHIFPSSPAMEANQTDQARGVATHRPYLFQRALFFGASTLPSEPPSIQSTPIPEYMHSCDLIMASQCFNIGLFFHLRSKNLASEQLRVSCQTMAIDFYSTAVEIITEPSVVDMAMSNPDSCSLLVVVFNNRAVMCHENGDYVGALNARQLLVLCLNTVATGGATNDTNNADSTDTNNDSAYESFLVRQDVLDLYGNGLLLLPPTTAGVA